MPLRTVATSELVVPRSIPTASLRSCGAGDSPGSEIWSSAIRPPAEPPQGRPASPSGGGERSELGGPSRLQIAQHRVDVGGHLAEELQLAHAHPRRLPRAIVVEQRGELE